MTKSAFESFTADLERSAKVFSDENDNRYLLELTAASDKIVQDIDSLRLFNAFTDLKEAILESDAETVTETIERIQGIARFINWNK